jgi:hypothetical protein
LPAYIVEVDKSNFPQLRDHYVREVTITDLVAGSMNVGADDLRSSDVVGDPTAPVMGTGQTGPIEMGGAKLSGNKGKNGWNFSTFLRKKMTPTHVDREEI